MHHPLQYEISKFLLHIAGVYSCRKSPFLRFFVTRSLGMTFIFYVALMCHCEPTLSAWQSRFRGESRALTLLMLIQFQHSACLPLTRKVAKQSFDGEREKRKIKLPAKNRGLCVKHTGLVFNYNQKLFSSDLLVNKLVELINTVLNF